MTKLPKSCKECELRVVALGMIGCRYLGDWIEPFEYRKDKLKLEKCPLENWGEQK